MPAILAKITDRVMTVGVDHGLPGHCARSNITIWIELPGILGDEGNVMLRFDPS
jgi:hypothetical protein